MNEVLATMMNHRSIRRFKEEQVPREQIEQIVRAAQMASSSNFMQSYSLIGITEPAMKEELGAITGLPYVATNGHLFIFCADLHRVTVRGTEEEAKNMESMLESSALYQIAVIDAALAAQNAALAAESLGLGVVIIGAIAKDIARLDTMLKLPKYVVPLFAMAIGVPDQHTDIKPRLPVPAVYFENHYMASREEQLVQIDQYDEQMSAYYAGRNENTRNDTWSHKHVAVLQSKVPVHHFTRYVQSKGLNRS
ncbi:nitroreductase family protein [Paenibacillus sp. P36]|uniref:nitroreductase family protein n=1 Tax=Paenibacillus sp. P36 TaxID=3342538 RepID=UPI0038B30A60